LDPGLHAFYGKLLQAIDRPALRDGQWSLCERTGWPDNASFQNLLSWNWLQGQERYLIVVNFSDYPSQAQVQVPWATPNEKWRLNDLLSATAYERDGNQMRSPGLYVDLGPWHYHFFHCSPLNRA